MVKEIVKMTVMFLATVLILSIGSGSISNHDSTQYVITEFELYDSLPDQADNEESPENPNPDLCDPEYRIIRFGHYEQDGNENNGLEEIEWLVLETDPQENKALIISLYGLDAIVFDPADYCTWEDSSIRGWLNESFFLRAFTEEEQQRIIPASVSVSTYYPASDSNMAKGELPEPTEDRVFLLTYDEAKQYFPTASLRRCKPTEMTTQVIESTWLLTHVREDGYFDWNTRTIYEGNDRVITINERGNFHTSVFWSRNQIRPVIWVDYAITSVE
ncbi:MAG: hypothetical protein IKP40_11810 [Clostridia bacterium]|nr:hypothetical protein [Clostridia bacterium]